ncbi:MAG: two-component regulator propeller domain-containing protein [Bacteroidota bacterium]
MKKIYSLTALSLLFLGSSFGSDSIVFHHIPEKISQSTITMIFEDPEGFLWFGTRYGLNKYDGRFFHTFLHNSDDSTTLSNNRINDVSIDEIGNFWIATDRGVNYLDRSTGLITQYYHDPARKNSLSSDFSACLLVDEAGAVWVGTEDKGLCKYDPSKDKFTRFEYREEDPFSISGNSVSALASDGQGNLWVGTRWGGVNFLDKATNRFVSYNFSATMADNSVRRLLADEKDLWVGTQRGLFKISPDSKGKKVLEMVSISPLSLQGVLEDAAILSLQKDGHGNLWVGTENEGLFVINEKGEAQHFTASKSNTNTISSNSIWSLFSDSQGIMWIGTFDNGIDKVDPLHRRFERYSGNPLEKVALSYNVVSSFAEEPGKGLWIGTDGGGLNFLDYHRNEVTVYRNADAPSSLSGDAVLSMLLDRSDNLWVASWAGGLSIKRADRFDFDRLIYEPDEESSLLGPDAYYLFEDSRSNIWISIFRYGANIYESETSKLLSVDATGLSSTKIRCIIEPSPGEYWLGTEGGGIDRLVFDESYNVLEHQNFNAASDGGLNHNVVTHLEQAEDGRIWITTFGGGLNIYDPNTKKFSHLMRRDGLPSNVLLSIEEDKNGSMWLGTANGLCQIDKDGDIRVFGIHDGIADAEFTKSASYINESGELFFGSNDGFYRFHPDEMVTNNTVPDVLLTDFVLLGKNKRDLTKGQLLRDVFPSGTIELAYNENDFAFQFAVLNYSQPLKNQYAYFLEGYDEDWRVSEDGADINYSNVLPGRYVLHVKGSNNDGVWNEEGESILLTIRRPWFFSNGMIIVYVLLAALLLLWFRHVTILRERLKNELKLEHLELTKMQDVDKLKSRFFANISHEFRTPLTLIIGPLKSLINGTYRGDAQSQYRMMARNAERLLRLINQVLDLSRLESGGVKLKAHPSDVVKFMKSIAHAFTSYSERQFIDYKCEFPEYPVEIYFEADKLEKVVINLLSNAFKYTQEFGKIYFKVRDTPDWVVLSVEDTGVGIPADQLEYIFDRFYQIDNGQEKGSGIGLALTKELVDLHGGKIEVSSKHKEGSTFSVYLKKGSQHLSEDEIVGEDEVKHQFEEDFKELSMMKTNMLPEQSEERKAVIEDLPIILVAEDNEDMREFISEYLVTNYRVIEARNGREALQAAHETIPDVIVSDVIMPGMNGYELCQQVKGDERTSHVPVILLTAKASGDSTEKGFEVGADYYVTKPFNPKLLELRIKNILNTREQLRHQFGARDDLSLEPRDLKIPSKDQEFLKKAIACIEDNLSNSDFGVDDLYRELGLSRTQLYRKLKGLVGQSANEFIRSFRLKRAAQLLKQHEMTISEVTYQVGFNDLQYFRYCFKKQFGSNPSEYAQRTH